MVQALAHLLYAVGAREKGHHEALLGALAHHLLQVAAHEQVEPLVRATELDVGVHGNGVVGLEQRVEQFGDGDGLIGGVPLREVVAGQYLGHGEAAGKPYHVRQREGSEPVALQARLGPGAVDDLEELREVRLGVLEYLRLREHGPGGRPAAGIADLRRPVAHDDDDLVAELLELPQLAQADGVPHVQVGSARVEAHLEAERPSAVQQLDELGLDDDLGDPSTEEPVSLGFVHARSSPPASSYRAAEPDTARPGSRMALVPATSLRTCSCSASTVSNLVSGRSRLTNSRPTSRP